MIDFEIYTVEEDSDNTYRPKKGDIRVKFPSLNEDLPTILDESGYRYFNVPNILNNPSNIFNRVYTGRVKDAYDMVANGNGDAIIVSSILGMKITNVLYFLDRTYGESIRSKFLEGWKSVKFTWGVEGGNPNSFGGYNLLLENYKTNNPFMSVEDNGKKFYFDSESEALKEIQKIKSICENWVEKYKKNPKDFFKKLEKNYSLDSVYAIWILSMLNEQKGKEQSYDLRVVQTIFVE